MCSGLSNADLRLGLGFDMKYHILHDFRAPTPLKEKFCDCYKDVYKLKILINVDVNLTSFLGGVMNYVFNL